jgi:hypothetical protein
VAQHTAVHIGRCAQALARADRRPAAAAADGRGGARAGARALRLAGGGAQVRALTDELAEVPRPAFDPRRRPPPTRCAATRSAPSRAFATQALALDTGLRPTPGATADAVLASAGTALDVAFPAARRPALCAEAFGVIEAAAGSRCATSCWRFRSPAARAGDGRGAGWPSTALSTG